MYMYHYSLSSFLITQKYRESCSRNELSLSYAWCQELQLSSSLVLSVVSISAPRTMFISVPPLDSISSLYTSIISVFRSQVQQCCNVWTAPVPFKANMHCTEGCIVPQAFHRRLHSPASFPVLGCWCIIGCTTGHRCSSRSLSDSSEARECERAESMEATVRYGSRTPWKSIQGEIWSSMRGKN